MYSCEVEPDFKIGFFKKFLNFCYDEKTCTVYADNLEVLKKLKVNEKTIRKAFCKTDEELETKHIEFLSVADVKNVCDKKIQEFEEKKQKPIEELEEQLKRNLEQNNVLKKSLTEIVRFQEDYLDEQEDKELEIENTIEKLKNSIGLLNKKIKESNSEISNLNVKVEAIIDILSEKNEDEIPNVISKNLSMEKIWDLVKDKNTAATLSIMLMMKKVLEEKGMRL